MFKREGIVALGREYKSTFQKLVELEKGLKQRFRRIDDAIEALVLAVAAGEALLLIGPPGTAKSRLIRAFCHSVGLLSDDDMAPPHGTTDTRPVKAHDDYFEYLLTQFTEPGELFGFYDLAALQGDPVTKRAPELRRDDQGMMQHAKIVFLDEVFNASSAILNSLLAFMNERKFHDRGRTTPVALECLFGATNDIPTSPELRAFFDRFLLRAWVDVVPEDQAMIHDLLSAGWRETHAPPHARKDFAGLLDELSRFRDYIERLTEAGELEIVQNAELIGTLAGNVRYVRHMDLSRMSNRRLVGFSKVILVHALLRWARRKGSGEPGIERTDLSVLMRFGTDRPVDPGELQKQYPRLPAEYELT